MQFQLLTTANQRKFMIKNRTFEIGPRIFEPIIWSDFYPVHISDLDLVVSLNLHELINDIYDI